MAADVQQDSDIDSEVRQRFDQVLGRHMERLIGTKYGIGGLPINSINVSCLIVLMERENEIEHLPSAESERYTLEALYRELEEMGFEPGREMNATVREMTDKGYIQIEQGSLIPQQPAVSMTRLVDKTFPQMPGLNLVAYFVQTMDEVRSGRKDIEDAVRQFDEVLNMKGVSLKKNAACGEKVSRSSVATEDNFQKADPGEKTGTQIISKKGSKRREILGRQNGEAAPQQIRAVSFEKKVLSADALKGNVQIRKLNFSRPLPVSDETEQTAPAEAGGTKVQETQCPDEPMVSTTPSKVDAKEADERCDNPVERLTIPPQPTGLDTNRENCDTAEIPDPQTEGSAAEAYANAAHTSFEDNATEIADEDIQKSVAEAYPNAAHTGVEDKAPEIADEDIEKSIAAFEEDLSMQCPMCKRAKVRAENTAKGKLYYKCSGKSCNFISWGKPYHIQCPQCNNPFLVETFDKAERLIFKCPRATCRYWQRPPWEEADISEKKLDSAIQKNPKVTSLSSQPRKRVVKRKRRVRRKK